MTKKYAYERACLKQVKYNKTHLPRSWTIIIIYFTTCRTILKDYFTDDHHKQRNNNNKVRFCVCESRLLKSATCWTLTHSKVSHRQRGRKYRWIDGRTRPVCESRARLRLPQDLLCQHNGTQFLLPF